MKWFKFCRQCSVMPVLGRCQGQWQYRVHHSHLEQKPEMGLLKTGPSLLAYTSGNVGTAKQLVMAAVCRPKIAFPWRKYPLSVETVPAPWSPPLSKLVGMPTFYHMQFPLFAPKSNACSNHLPSCVEISVPVHLQNLTYKVLTPSMIGRKIGNVTT